MNGNSEIVQRIAMIYQKNNTFPIHIAVCNVKVCFNLVQYSSMISLLFQTAQNYYTEL